MRLSQVQRLVKRKSGVLLDISFGGEPQPNSLTLHKDLNHDPLNLPFPLPDKCVHTAVITHVLEYMDPQVWFFWWDELHRVMRDGGIVYASGPYGGDESAGWLSDPTHRTRVVEQSFVWMDPRTPFYEANADVGRPLPKPWFVVADARVPATHGTYSYNVTLQKAKKVARR